VGIEGEKNWLPISKAVTIRVNTTPEFLGNFAQLILNLSSAS